MWEKLAATYQSQGLARHTMLLKSLILHKMRNGKDIAVQLEFIDEMLLCSISEEYEGFRIAIESHNKLPTSEILKIN